MPGTILIHQTVDTGDERLLPDLEDQVPRSLRAFGVEGVGLDPVDGVVCLLLVEEKLPALDPVDDNPI